MRIFSVEAFNFGSYEHVKFEMTRQGLTLISGPTGCGKSTLCDLIPWALFGCTAKNGAADDVRPWDGSEPTKVIVWLQDVTISRTRGSKNDLSFWPNGGVITRGKDLNDTQKLINEKLGLTAETFLASSYFHEFSQTAGFFTASAKTRRQITEQLVDLTQAKKLTESMSEYKKELKAELDKTKQEAEVYRGKLNIIKAGIKSAELKVETWEANQAAQLIEFQKASDKFTEQKQAALAQIESDHIELSAGYEYDMIELEKEIVQDEVFSARRKTLESKKKALEGSKCESCGAPKDVDKLMIINKELYKVDNEQAENQKRKIQLKTLSQRLAAHMKTLEPKLQAERERPNAYIGMIEANKKTKNPHKAYIKDGTTQLEEVELELEGLDINISGLKQELEDVELLTQVTQDLRGALLKQAVDYLQHETNTFLSTHFDSEFKVKFDIESADKLDVTIYKDENICNYSQLSKGQRQILRLTFALAVMKCVANNSGIKPSVVMLDEFSDGLDEEMKLKAFSLVEAFSKDYETVIAIDHNEAVKSMFTNRYDVELVNGKSEIQQV